MINLSLTHYYAPLLILIVSFIIIFAALKKVDFTGNSWTTAILSLLLSFIIVSSDSLVNYMVDLLPLLTVITVVGFIFTLMLVFVNYDKSPFKKILAWMGFILAVLIVLSLAFDSFPTMAHLLPSSSDSGLNYGLRTIKHEFYTQDFRDFLVFVVSIAVVSVLMVGTFKAKKG